MQLHGLKRQSAHPRARRVGRGGKRGKTSGRGMKGQTARAGNSTRPEIREWIKKLPKRRGHGKNRARTVNLSRPRPSIVDLAAVGRAFAAGASVTPQALLARGLVRGKGGRVPLVKILGVGALSKRLAVSGCILSRAARASIEAQGGTIT